MASHSPSESKGQEAAADGRYLEGWTQLAGQMDQGSGWSGHERNCALLNLGERRFVDVSFVAGLDFEQDGRAVAPLDWDGDGDLDLWLKSRNGQQLRLLENQLGGGGNFLALRLRGTDCNRDAVGARVEVRTDKHRYLREVRAGEGYLAQSSLELLVGLGAGETLAEVSVHWPGGSREAFDGVELGRRHRLVQGAGLASVLPLRKLEKKEPRELPTLPASKRVVLRTPLPMPTAYQRAYFGAAKPGVRLINLWATWCAPCVEELGNFAERHQELLDAGVQVLPFCLDGEAEPEGAVAVLQGRIANRFKSEARFDSRNMSAKDRSLFKVLFEHLIASPGEMPVPTSFLVDSFGQIVVLYLGPVDVDSLLLDVESFGRPDQAAATRASFPGRWFFGMPRDWAGLSRAFEREGLSICAKFYEALAKRALRTPR